MKYKLELPLKENKILTKNGKKVAIIGDCTITYSLSSSMDGSRITGFDSTEASVKERIKLENELFLKEGSLLPYSTYWDTFFIHVPARGVILDDSNPLDRLKLKVLGVDKKVAKSIQEYESNPTKFLFILKSTQLESVNRNKRRELVGKAYGILNKLSANDKLDVLMLYGKTGAIVNNMSPEVVEASLGDLMEENYEKFIMIAGDSKLKVKSLIIKYIEKGIITKGNRQSTYDQDLYYEGERIGFGLDEAVVWLLDSKNAQTRQAIDAQLKLK